MKIMMIYIKKALFTFTSILILINCSEFEGPIDNLSKSRIEILKPTNNSHVSDSITVSIFAFMHDLVRVELYIDHNIPLDGVFQTPPFNYYWNTEYYSDGSQHILQAKAYDKQGNSIASKFVIVNVYRFMPSNLNAFIISDSLIELNWRDNSKFEVGFELEEAINDSNFLSIAELDSNTTNYTRAGSFNLEDIYYYRIRAKSKDNYSGYSNIAVANLELQPVSSAKVDLISDTSAVFSWDDTNDFESQYIIQKRNMNNSFSTLSVLPANTTSTTIIDTFLADYNHIFRIFALMNGILGPETYFHYTPLYFPAPYDLTVNEVNSSALELNWLEQNEFESRFIIERAEDGVTYIERGQVGRNTTSFIDNNLDTSKEYSYRVIASSCVNLSEPSEVLFSAYLDNYSLYERFQVESQISWMTVSNDAAIIAIGGYLSFGVGIFIYDTFSGQKLKTLRSVNSYEDRIFENIAISPDNNLIAATSDTYFITVWDIITETVVERISTNYISDVLRFSPDGNYLLVECGGTVRYYNTTTWQYETKISTSNTIWEIVTTPDQARIITSDVSTEIKIWDFDSGNLISQLNNSAGGWALQISPNGELLYGMISNDLYGWKLTANSIILELTDFGRVRRAAVSGNGQYAAGSYINGGGISLWSLDDIIHIADYKNNDEIFVELVFTPDNKYLIGREFYRNYYIWKFKKEWLSPIR